MGKTYYVSAKNGSDKNPGTQDKPFKSIQAGINKTTPGDTVLVREGVYAEQLVISKSATAAEPITIATYQKEKAIVDGRNMALKEAARLVLITYSRHVKFAGFEVRQSGGRGIGVDNSDHVTIDGCTVYLCQSGGIFVKDSEEIVIENCDVHACAQKFLASGNRSLSVAVLFRTSNKVTARKNTVYENTAQGIGILYTVQADIVGNTCYDNRQAQIEIASGRTITVTSNLCYHTGRQQYLDLRGKRPPAIEKNDERRYQDAGVWHSDNITVANNVIIGCGNGFCSNSDGGALTNFQLAHNTIIDCTNEAISVKSELQHVQAIFENNLVANQANRAPVVMYSSRGVIWRYNLWSQLPADYAYNPSSDIVTPNVGLKDIGAPVAAGKVDAESYGLTAISPAVNTGHQSDINVDFWGDQRGAKPDIGAHEFDKDSGDSGGVDLPPDDVRVTAGLQALYDFSSGWGNTVADTSGQGDPLNLTIAKTSAVKWGDGGLTILAPTTISSGKPALKVIAACKQKDEVTVEAWIRPATVDQSGPARIVTISEDWNTRNVTLGQGLKDGEPTDLYNVRLRTSMSSENGIPSISSPDGSLTAQLAHVVFTRTAAGRAVLYINGQERAVDTLRGNLNSWDPNMKLTLASETGGSAPWLGFFRLVAIYDRALLPEEVVHNYTAGLPKGDPITVVFRIKPGQEAGTVPHQVDFDASESSAIWGINSYQWDFGDGGTSTEESPSHVYERTGVFNVTLTITDKNGSSASQTAAGLVSVAASPLPTLPSDYARFVLANLVESRILGFGIQYPDFRCMLAWNEDPYHIMIYRDFADIVSEYRQPGTIELLWIDHPEEDVE